MDATLRPFSLPLREPLLTSSGPIERRDGVLVRVASDGVVGIGEATPLPGWTESLDACTSALERATTHLSGGSLESALDGLVETPAARHGLSLALADLEATRTGQPLYRFLGREEHVESVPVNATIGDGDVAETVSAGRDAVEAGFDCIKLKVGTRSVEDDVARVAAVRDVVGPDVTLRADANGAWSQEQAREALDAFAEYGVEYVEQPLDPADLDGLAGLRGGPVEIAADESLAAMDPSEVIETGAADVLIVKPMVLGGIDLALEVAGLAASSGLRAVVTTTVDGAVARTAAVHLTARLEEPAPAGLATAGWLAEDVAADPAPVRDGRAHVPRSSGHGVRIEGWSR